MASDECANLPRNRVLQALSPADMALLAPHMRWTRLGVRQRLQAPNRRVETVYFLDSGVASVVAVGGGSRRQAEVGIIGREGMAGLPILHYAERSPCEILMQVEGSGQSIAAEDLRAATQQSLSLLQCLLRYAHVLSVQSNYTALANAQGRVQERLARWLLMAQDRIESNELVLTHDFLALMLGARRTGVTLALQQFEDKGVIATSRGSVKILDREGLEVCASGFYGAPEAEFERLFPSRHAPSCDCQSR